MDTHNFARERCFPSPPPLPYNTTHHDTTHTHTPTPTPPIIDPTSPDAPDAQSTTLAARALIISIETDGLFTPSEQRDLATHISGAEFVVIPSPDGHDGLLLEFEQISRRVLAFLNRKLPTYYQGAGARVSEKNGEGDFGIKKTSLFGKAEADVTRWWF